MKDTQVGTGVFQHFVAQYVDVLYTFVLHKICETFALHTSHIENICISYDFFRKVGVFYELNAMFTTINFVFFRLFQLFGSYEMECRVEVAHCHQQGVYGTSVFQITHKIDVQVLQSALCLVDRVEVEHRLRGVLVGSVSSIDNGNCGNLAGIACRSFQIVPHYDDIGVIAYHFDGVFQRFTFG